MIYTSNLIYSLLKEGLISRFFALFLLFTLAFKDFSILLEINMFVKILLVSLAISIVLNVIEFYAKRRIDPKAIISFLIIVTLVSMSTGKFLIGNVIGREPVANGIENIDFPHKVDAWEKAQIWAKNNTELDDVFITPPRLSGFRVFSQRSVVAEGRDGTLAFYDDGFAIKWRQRIQELSKIETLTTIEIEEIAQKYNAAYLVVPKNINFQFNEVYENSEFRIYSLL